jgi:hypothetical protein
VFDYTNDANDYKIIVEEARTRREKYREREAVFFIKDVLLFRLLCVCVLLF